MPLSEYLHESLSSQPKTGLEIQSEDFEVFLSAVLA